jgi:hypothetical protein
MMMRPLFFGAAQQKRRGFKYKAKSKSAHSFRKALSSLYMFLLSLLEPTALRVHTQPDARFRHGRVGVAMGAVESMVWRLHHLELSDSARRALRRQLTTALPPDLNAVQIDEQLEALSIEAYKAYVSSVHGNHMLHLVASVFDLIDESGTKTTMAMMETGDKKEQEEAAAASST